MSALNARKRIISHVIVAAGRTPSPAPARQLHTL
jgi:hypothetical protein